MPKSKPGKVRARKEVLSRDERLVAWMKGEDEDGGVSPPGVGKGPKGRRKKVK